MFDGGDGAADEILGGAFGDLETAGVEAEGFDKGLFEVSVERLSRMLSAGLLRLFGLFGLFSARLLGGFSFHGINSFMIMRMAIRR